MIKKIIIVAVAIVLLALGVWFFMGMDKGSSEDVSGTDLTQQNLVDQAREQVPEIIATVNGEGISKEDFFRMGEQVAGEAARQGIDITNSNSQNQISNEAISRLVNSEVLLQAAKASEAVASTTAVESQYAQIIATAGGEEELRAQVEQVGISIETVRQDLEESSLVREYLVAELSLEDITVSEEEIKNLYDELTATVNSSTTPSLEESSEQLEAQVKVQKESQLISEHLQVLIEQAEVEVTL